MLHADCFRGCDLHVINEESVPDRFKNAIAKPENQDVLNGLFAQVVIDSINLPLVESPLNFTIELLRRREIAAKRFLDDDPSPPAVLFGRQTGASQLPDNA